MELITNTWSWSVGFLVPLPRSNVISFSISVIIIFCWGFGYKIYKHAAGCRNGRRFKFMYMQNCNSICGWGWRRFKRCNVLFQNKTWQLECSTVFENACVILVSPMVFPCEHRHKSWFLLIVCDTKHLYGEWIWWRGWRSAALLPRTQGSFLSYFREILKIYCSK